MPGGGPSAASVLVGGPFRGCFVCLLDGSETGQPVPLIRAWPENQMAEKTAVWRGASGCQVVDPLPEGRHLCGDEVAPGDRVPEFHAYCRSDDQKIGPRFDSKKFPKALGDDQTAAAGQADRPLACREQPTEILDLVESLREAARRQLAAKHVDSRVEPRLPGGCGPE